MVDGIVFRVYFYTHMEHESTTFSRSLSFSYRSSGINGELTTLPSADLGMFPSARTFIRYGSVEHLETLFSRLKDGALLIAALAYGLELPASIICSLRVRDVNLASQSVVIKARAYQLPKMVVDDLREYLQEKMCGYEASVSLSKRDQPLFSEAERAVFEREVFSWWRVFKLTQECREKGTEGDLVTLPAECAVKDVEGATRVVDRALGLIGRAHLHRAQKRNMKLSSALELFDKGPRIVRRTRCGVVTAYYVWRARTL